MNFAVFKSGILVVVFMGAVFAQTTIRTTTTLVVVPTLVQTPGKELVFFAAVGRLRPDGQRRSAEGNSGRGDDLTTVVGGKVNADRRGSREDGLRTMRIWIHGLRLFSARLRTWCRL